MSQDNNLKLEVGLLSICGSIISDSHVLSCQHVPLISRYACFCSRVDLKKKKKIYRSVCHLFKCFNYFLIIILFYFNILLLF